MNYSLEEIELVKIKTLEQVDNRGVFEIEPLSPGYGVTIGNSLRRVLLSSLEGAAITAVKIDGATHQFMTLPKIKEDAVEIILNLKRLRFKFEGSDPITLKLQAKGPKVATEKDFERNPNCLVVDNNTPIATLGKGASLKLEITVERGRGYVPVEQRKDEKLPIGTISVDSIFTPVKKVHYEVENTRVGQMTNFDKLTMEITTDGSIEPEEALGRSAKILLEHFTLVVEACAKSPKKDENQITPKKKPVKKNSKSVSKKQPTKTKSKK